MSEAVFIKQCAPTLAGIKTGSLFPCDFTDNEELISDVREINRTLAPKGLSLVVMRKTGTRALMYLYRPDKLRRDMRSELACKLMKNAGYSGSTCGELVAWLTRKIKAGEGFPHEIGLLLGYPPEDVKGFIDNGAANFKSVGCWKVYGDAERAEKTFESYRKCTENYYKRWQSGATVEQLAVKM